MEYQTEQRQLSSSTLCVKSLATIPPHVYTYVYTLARRSRRVEIRVKLIPTRRSGDTLPFNLPGTASKEPARSARSSSNSLHDIPSSRSLLISNQKCPRRSMCPRCQQLSARRDRSTRGCGSARVPRASPAESEWTGSHVRPAPLRLSRNVTTTAAIFASFRFVRFLPRLEQQLDTSYPLLNDSLESIDRSCCYIIVSRETNGFNSRKWRGERNMSGIGDG